MAVNIHVNSETKNLSLLKNGLRLLGGNKQKPSFSELNIGPGLLTGNKVYHFKDLISWISFTPFFKNRLTAGLPKVIYFVNVRDSKIV